MNHGIELHGDVVLYARRRLDAFIQRSPHFDAFEFCEPRFVTGNALLAAAGGRGTGGTGGIGERRYDRVYCGAACPPQHQSYIKSLVNIGGILVMPFDDQVSSTRFFQFMLGSQDVELLVPVKCGAFGF